MQMKVSEILVVKKKPIIIFEKSLLIGVDKPYNDAFDRLQDPRMGWHDVHVNFKQFFYFYLNFFFFFVVCCRWSSSKRYCSQLYPKVESSCGKHKNLILSCDINKVEMWNSYPHLFPKIKPADHCLDSQGITTGNLFLKSIYL
jgi:hypothetical protein